MLDVAFWFEFRRRAEALIWIALINPPLLLLHALTDDSPRPWLEVWLIGLGATFLVCLAGGIFVYFATKEAIRKGIRFVRHEKELLDLANRGPQMRQVPPRTEAG
jgi:hypothetical protein